MSRESAADERGLRRAPESVTRALEAFRARWTRFVASVFGDSLGLAVFLASLVFAMLTWRVGVFITDNYTLGNTLVALADGHLSVERAVYGPGLDTPGMHLVDGRAYGRNYGQLFLALPFLWALEGVAAVADPRIALSACWSLLVLALALVVGRHLDRRTAGPGARAFALGERTLAVGGSAFAVGAFALNVALATPLDPRWFPFLALQASTMVAAALAGVLLYRTLVRLHGRRAGVVGGAAVALATPVGFWATLPKRHVLTTLLVLCSVYALVRSREATSPQDRRFRALAYVPVGLTAWVHAPEALVLLTALALVDISTAERNDARTLALVGVVLVVSLGPFFVTNALIAGDPLTPPRLLPDYDAAAGKILGTDAGPTAGTDADTSAGSVADGGSGIDGGSGGDGGSVADGGSGADGGNDGGGAVGGVGDGMGGVSLVAGLADALGPLVIFASLLTEGVHAIVVRPARLTATFLHSGYIRGVAAGDGGQAINLAIFESGPLLGALLAVPLAVLGRSHRHLVAHFRSPAGVGDAFALAYAVVLTLAYVPRLPLHAQVTVRYLLPLFALGVYGIVRLPVVRHAVEDHADVLAWTYAVCVLVGGQLLLAWFVAANVALGEAIQVHALLGLAVGVALGVWTATATVRGRDNAHLRFGAVLLGAAAAATTVFLLLSALLHFAYAGPPALPFVPALP